MITEEEQIYETDREAEEEPEQPRRGQEPRPALPGVRASGTSNPGSELLFHSVVGELQLSRVTQEGIESKS